MILKGLLILGLGIFCLSLSTNADTNQQQPPIITEVTSAPNNSGYVYSGLEEQISVYNQLRANPELLRSLTNLSLNEFTWSRYQSLSEAELQRIISSLQSLNNGIYSQPAPIDTGDLLNLKDGNDDVQSGFAITGLSLANREIISPETSKLLEEDIRNQFNYNSHSSIDLQNLDNDQSCLESKDIQVSCTRPVITHYECNLNPTFSGAEFGVGEKNDIPEIVGSIPCGDDCLKVYLKATTINAGNNGIGKANTMALLNIRGQNPDKITDIKIRYLGASNKSQVSTRKPTLESTQAVRFKINNKTVSTSFVEFTELKNKFSRKPNQQGPTSSKLSLTITAIALDQVPVLRGKTFLYFEVQFKHKGTIKQMQIDWQEDHCPFNHIRASYQQVATYSNIPKTIDILLNGTDENKQNALQELSEELSKYQHAEFKLESLYPKQYQIECIDEAPIYRKFLTNLDKEV